LKGKRLKDFNIFNLKAAEIYYFSDYYTYPKCGYSSNHLSLVMFECVACRFDLWLGKEIRILVMTFRLYYLKIRQEIEMLSTVAGQPLF